MPNNQCPYCQAVLNPVPTRKKACPACGKIIVIRKGALMTEDEAYIAEWLTRLDITRIKFDEHREALSKKLKVTASVNDTIWRILNRKPDSMDYLNMGRLAESEGKDPKPYLREAQRYTLLQYQKNGVKTVRIHTMNDSFVCPACKARAGKEMTVEQALEELPIDHCTGQFGCRCSF